MADGSDDPTDPATIDLEALLARQYVERLEALDRETERLLESMVKSGANPFDGQTRARATRHLREIRAQIHPLLIALRYRADCATTDDERPAIDRDGDRDWDPQDSI